MVIAVIQWSDFADLLHAGELSGYFTNALPLAGMNTAFGVTTANATFDVVYDFDQDTVTLMNVVATPIPEPASLLAGLTLIACYGLIRRR